MQALLKRLDKLKTNPQHKFNAPASPQAIATVRKKCPSLPEDLVTLYQFANGFELYTNEEIGANLTLWPCSEHEKEKASAREWFANEKKDPANDWSGLMDD